MHFLFRFLFLLTLVWSLPAQAQVSNPVDLGREPSVSVGGRFLFLRDESGLLTLEQVIREASQGGFVSPGSKPLGLGVVKGATWLRMEFHNAQAEPIRRWLESTHLLQQYYDLYLFDASGVLRSRSRSGAAVPVDEREVPARNVLLPIDLLAGETLTAYVRISGKGATRLDFKVWDPAAKLEDQRTDDAWTFLVLGLSLVVVFFSIQSFLVRKEPIMLASGAAQVLLLLVRALLQGHFTGLIPQNEEMWLTRMSLVGILGSFMLHALFARSFLDLPGTMPRLAIGLKRLGIGCGLMAGMQMVWFVPGLFLAIAPFIITALFAAVVVAHLRKPGAPASYLLTWALIFSTIVLRVAWIAGLLTEPGYSDLLTSCALSASSLTLSHALYVDLNRRRSARATDRSRLQEQERAEKARLEQAVSERTEALAQAVAVAEAANRAKSDFLSTVSHELRTPLHTMLGQLQLLEQEGAGVARRATLARRSGEHLLALINDLLIYSRGEANSRLIEKGPVDLAGLARELAGSGGMLAGNKGLVFALELSPHLPRTVLADRKHLAQVLLNLIDNACKYTEQGRVILRLQCESMGQTEPEVPADGWYRVRFEVEDTGIGIAPEDRLRIFEPFRQLHPTTAARGLGMGLAIVRQLVEAMGAKIQVVGAPGQGSRFWFELRLRGLRPSELTPVEEAPLAQIVGHLSPQRAVLVVDDMEENRCLLCDALRKWGFQVIEADGGRNALEICKGLGQGVDMVLVDQYMPEVDGWAFLEGVRRLPGFSELPVVLLSAALPQRSEGMACDYAFNGYLLKPFRLEDLEDLLARLLGLEWVRETRAAR